MRVPVRVPLWDAAAAGALRSWRPPARHPGRRQSIYVASGARARAREAAGVSALDRTFGGALGGLPWEGLRRRKGVPRPLQRVRRIES